MRITSLELVNDPQITNFKLDFTVDNVVNAYINSDIHKKNLEEIAESKVENAEAVGE